MEITTSWMEEGIELGIQQGLQQGLQKGLQQGLQSERGLVLRQLARRVGVLSQRAQASIARLSFEQLENLGEALLDFREARDLTRWLREHAAPTGKPNGTPPKKINPLLLRSLRFPPVTEFITITRQAQTCLSQEELCESPHFVKHSLGAAGCSYC